MAKGTSTFAHASGADLYHVDYSDFAGVYSRFVGMGVNIATARPVEVAAAPPVSPTRAEEIGFLNGVDADGNLTNQSYWGKNGETAYKWGDTQLGTGATITYFFDGKSKFTDIEKATFLKAFAMWSAVADVTFVEATSKASAGVLLHRGNDGGAYNSTPSSQGSGSTPGAVTGQALISIDTSVGGFDLSGSLDTYGGYGMSAIIHEVGHLLGLGHGGDYNGDVNARTDQFSAYDDRMYSIMSYIYWGNGDAKFLAQNPNQGTDWGTTIDGIDRQSPHSIMALDILAVQQLYGVSTHSPFAGGQTYGFHSNIAGPLAGFFDFSINTDPVVTLYNQGTGNTLDLSGYAMAQNVDLRPGEFSDVGGHVNNVAIADGTVITTAIGGSGNDTLRANDVQGVLLGGAGDDTLLGGAGRDQLTGGGDVDRLDGNGGRDRLSGGGGADTFVFDSIKDTAKTMAKADIINDFLSGDGDKIDLSGIDAIRGGGDQPFTFIGLDPFSGAKGELHYAIVGANAFVSGDVNGDGVADFMIQLHGVTQVVATDFVL